MAKITFTEELLNKPIIPKYNKNLEQSESDDDAEPAALNFGESKEAFDKLTKEQESYLKKQDKITKKNKNLIQMRNLIQKKESEQRKAELNESKNEKSKEQLKMEKLRAFDEQLKQMEAKAARNRTKTGFEEDENLEELDLGFLESIESEPKQKIPRRYSRTRTSSQRHIRSTMPKEMTMLKLKSKKTHQEYPS